MLAITATGAVSASSSATPVTATALNRIQHRRVLSYPLDQVWPATVRYLRVDRRYPIIDHDQDVGFILFDFPVDHRPDAVMGRGSIELVAIEDASGRPSVKLQVSADAGPAHLPHAIADGLAQKLRDERGQPAPPPARPPTEPPTDDPYPGPATNPRP